MPNTKTLTGGCHCGLVRFECTTDLAMVTACNCSICTKKGLHFAFLPPKSFVLRAGEDNLREYLFNKHAITKPCKIRYGFKRLVIPGTTDANGAFNFVGVLMPNAKAPNPPLS